MNLKTGHLLAGGRYKVERVLGQGGFGITYEARDTKFKSRDKSVAIKEFFVENFCNREEGTDRIIVATQSKVELVEKLRNKFIDEANALFGLKHPGIVRVTDTFEENGTAYYVMEYINGSTLSSIIETDGPLSEEKALGYIRQAAAVLEYLHGQNRLHLDIKPQNIMADNDGRVVLIDFGVSKQYDEVKGENTSTLMGYTPGYAPLEQCNNAVVEFTPTTDIYSLGATLYKLLTGQTPPNASEVNENGLPALPPHISAPVRAAVETAMQPRRKDRPQSVGEFLALLDKKVKAENGNVETESNDDGETVIANSSTLGGEVSRSDGGENVGKSKDDDDGATEILHSVQDDKYRENSSSTPGGEVSRSDGGEEYGNVTASNALFIKNGPPYFLIIADLIIFITDITLLYCECFINANIVIPTERSDEGSQKLHAKEISPHCNRRNDNMPGVLPYYIIILTINISYEKNTPIHVACRGNAFGQLYNSQ